MSIDSYRDLLAQADNWEKASGKRWYLDAKSKIETISRKSGIEFNYCAGIVAVLSPMVEWHLNLRIAERFIMSKGKQRGAGFNRNYEKAKRILKQGDLSAVKGPKVKSFYETLKDPNYFLPVIDTHMIAAFWKGKAYRDDLNIVAQSEKRLTPIRSALVELAKEKGNPVSVIQATIWLTFKRLNSEYSTQLKLWG